MGTCCSAPQPVVAKEVWDEFYDETMINAGSISSALRGVVLIGHQVPTVIGPYASVAYRASPETGWPALEFYAKILRIPAVLLDDGSTLRQDEVPVMHIDGVHESQPKKFKPITTKNSAKETTRDSSTTLTS